MAINAQPWDLIAEAIQEYLDTAKDCLAFTKSDGGCRGYPSALLLLCSLDALGKFAANEIVTVDGKQERIGERSFRVLNHPKWFGLSLADAQMKKIKGAFRHTLAHNALLIPMAYLNGDPHSVPFVFHGDAVEIRLLPLYDLLHAAWAKYDKPLIEQWVKANPKLIWTLPQSAVLPTPYVRASSGCP